MVEYEDIQCLINDLQNIQSKEQQIKKKIQQADLNRCILMIDKISFLYKKESEYTYKEYIEPFINKYSFLQTLSVLGAINKLKYETFHSLILKELWNPTHGKQLLSNFIATIDDILPSDRIKLQEYILKGNYFIEEEHTIKNNKKRIDLLITDNAKRWFILIENKIDAKINISLDNKTQLQYYHKYGETKLKEYTNRYYILLSHRDNKKDAIEPWKYTTYNNVFLSLIKTIPDARIVQDYLSSLFSLLYPNNISQNTIGNSLYKSYQFYHETIKHIK